MTQSKHLQDSFANMLTRLSAGKDTKPAVAIREDRKYFLIVSEGVRTEPIYFEYLASQLPKHLVDTIKIDGAGADTVRVVEKAIKLRNERKKNKLLPEYEQVWAVYDKDDFPEKNYQAAITLAQKEKIESAHSNQSFELWYILHFEYLQSALHRDDYMTKLSKHLNVKYEKNQLELAKRIHTEGSWKLAIKRAKKLDKTHEDAECTASKACPSTKVYILAERLMAYIENRPAIH